MSLQICTLVLLVCVAATYGRKLGDVHSTNILPIEKEGRILVVPTLEDVVYTGLKLTWFTVSTAWSLIGYKLATITLIANVAIWIANNCLHAIIGAALTLAFCKITGKCTLDYTESYEPELILSAKHLADGTAKFTS